MDIKARMEKIDVKIIEIVIGTLNQLKKLILPKLNKIIIPIEKYKRFSNVSLNLDFFCSTSAMSLLNN